LTGRPAHDRLQRPRIQAVEPAPAVTAAPHESRLAQDAQVLRDRRLRHPEGTRELGDGAFPVGAEALDERAPGGVCDRAQDEFGSGEGCGHGPES
jgi:hypothetical protein